jgi:hypothetical protein
MLPESDSPDGGHKFKLHGFTLVADRRGPAERSSKTKDKQ